MIDFGGVSGGLIDLVALVAQADAKVRTRRKVCGYCR
jgi:hypothetical protein